nr:hypothetical protein [Kiritimatiellia bacterium]
FTNFSSAKVYVRQIEVLHDGTRHLEMGISGQFPVPGLLVKLNIHAAGVVFENGTNLLELTEEDFDETGFKPVSFYLPPGVNLCHQLRIYQNGVFVGRR